MSKHSISVNLTRLRTQCSLTDITLNVSGTKFRAHKIVLAGGSEYFERLLLGPFASSVTDEINIDAEPVEFNTILNLIYGEEFKYTNTDENRNISLALSYFQVHGFDRDSIINAIVLTTDPKEIKDTLDYLALLYPEKNTGFFIEELQVQMIDIVRKRPDAMHMLSDEYIRGFLMSEWFTKTFTSIYDYFNAIEEMIVNHSRDLSLLNILNYNLLPHGVRQRIPMAHRAAMTGPIPNLTKNTMNMRRNEVVLMVTDDLSNAVDGDGNKWRFSIQRSFDDLKKGLFNTIRYNEGDIIRGRVDYIMRDKAPTERIRSTEQYPTIYLK